MYHNLHAGRMRDYVKVFVDSGETNEYGEPVGYTFVFDARCDMLVKSGKEVVSVGSVLTSTIVSAMMWYDERMQNDQVLEWNGSYYTVNHCQPDALRRSMVITAEIITGGILTLVDNEGIEEMILNNGEYSIVSNEYVNNINNMVA